MYKYTDLSMLTIDFKHLTYYGTKHDLIESKLWIMAQKFKLGTKIIAVTLLLFGLSTLSFAQTTAKLVNSSDNAVVFTIENLEEAETPNKILLVYDSNLITLESTSTKARMVRASYKSNTKESHFNATSALAFALAEDIEREQEIEEWMHRPFETKINYSHAAVADKEEEIELEPWMTDLTKW